MSKYENAVDLEKKLKQVKDVKDKLLKIYDDMDAIKYVLLNPEDIGFCKDEVDRCIIFVTETQFLLFTVSVKEE